MVKKRYLLVSSLISSVIVIIISLCIIAGSTFAAGSLENVQNIAVRAGNVDVVATAGNLKLYSAEKVGGIGNDRDEIIYDENGNSYKYVECNGGKFINGGTAKTEIKNITDNNETKKVHTIALSEIVAGDKVEFDIHVKNNSNVAINYSAWFEVVKGLNESYEEDFFHMLDITLKSEGKDKVTVTNETQSYTGQTTIRAKQKEIEDVHVTISLPLDAGKEYMGKSINLAYRVQAIAATEDVASAGGQSFKTLAEAVEHAKAENISDINLIGDVYGEVVPIDSPLKIISIGKDAEISDTVFKVLSGPYLELENLGFVGNSYIDASEASALVVNNCDVNVTPDKLYDYGTRQTLDRAAFVVSNTRQTSGMRLTFTNNRIASVEAESAAVFLGSNLANGSKISGNTFGTSNRAYNSSAVAFVGATEGSEVKIENNTFYSTTAIEVGQNVFADGTAVTGNENFVVYSNSNTVVCNSIEKNLARLTGKAVFLDTKSTVDGSAVDLGNITAESMLFFGVNVTRDDSGYITTGDFALSSAIDAQTFKMNYVAASANQANITILINGVKNTLDEAISKQ